MLKSKDPRIYDSKTNFFASKKTDENDDDADVDADDGKKKKKAKKEKPMTIADLERKVMLEKGGKFEEMDEFKPSTRSEQKNKNTFAPFFSNDLSSLNGLCPKEPFLKVILNQKLSWT